MCIRGTKTIGRNSRVGCKGNECTIQKISQNRVLVEDFWCALYKRLSSTQVAK